MTAGSAGNCASHNTIMAPNMASTGLLMPGTNTLIWMYALGQLLNLDDTLCQLLIWMHGRSQIFDLDACLEPTP